MNPSTRILVVLALSSLFGTKLTAAQQATESKSPLSASAVTFHTQTSTPSTTPDTSTAAAASPLTATVGTQFSTSVAASSSTKIDSPASSPTSTPATTTAPTSPAPTAKTPSESTTSVQDYSTVTSLPTSTLPGVQRHPEQINGLNFFERLKDATDYQTLSHENYLEKHVKNQTLPVALPTADLQRAKFGHAANELVQKAFKRRDQNTIKRMSKLIRSAETYNIELNEADLTRMKEQAIDQIKDALATLALLNSKIKTKPATPTPFDLVGAKKEESKR